MTWSVLFSLSLFDSLLPTSPLCPSLFLSIPMNPFNHTTPASRLRTRIRTLIHPRCKYFLSIVNSRREVPYPHCSPICSLPPSHALGSDTHNVVQCHRYSLCLLMTIRFSVWEFGIPRIIRFILDLFNLILCCQVLKWSLFSFSLFFATHWFLQFFAY